MAEAGADLIELGIPFSDPIAEGPVIQQADIRALSSGATTDKIFDMVQRIRESCRYSNCLYDIHQSYLHLRDRTIFEKLSGSWN